MRLSAVLALALLSVGAAAPAKRKHAYATIHYEGTKNDDGPLPSLAFAPLFSSAVSPPTLFSHRHIPATGPPHPSIAAYVLGIRTLIASVREAGNTEDFLCLMAPNVRASSRRALEADGCILRNVSMIENPYKDHVLGHFEFTFIKLHLWNQTDYDRLIYMDADNIALGELSSLFYCGQFCAEYMNPVNFHTGLMVIKPSVEEFASMRRALHDPKIKSYDGADQGFLTAYFPYEQMINAPLYDEKACMAKGGCENRLNRLPVGYNLNAFWFYEKGHWGLYRQHGMPWSESDPPGVTLAFCVPPWLKPWFWWSHILMDVNWRTWHEKRSLLHEDDALTMPLYLLPPIVMLAIVNVVSRTLHRVRNASIEALSRMKGFAVGCGVATVYFSLSVSFKAVPSLINPREGWELFIVYQTTVLACCIMIFKALFEVHDGLLTTAKDVAPTVVVHIINLITTTYRMYPVVTVHVGRIGMLAGLFVVWVAVQLRVFTEFSASVAVAEKNRRPGSVQGLPGRI